MIACSEEGKVAADRIGIGAVAVPGKVEIPLVGELLPSPIHVVADKDEDDARAALLLGGEVFPERGHGVEVEMTVDRHHAHLGNGRLVINIPYCHLIFSHLISLISKVIRAAAMNAHEHKIFRHWLLL